MFFFDALTGTYNLGGTDIVFPRDFGATKDMGTDHSYRYVKIPTNQYLGITQFYVGCSYGSGSSGNYFKVKRSDGTLFEYSGSSTTNRDIDGCFTVYMKYEGKWNITNTNNFNLYIITQTVDGITAIAPNEKFEWSYSKRQEGMIIYY